MGALTPLFLIAGLAIAVPVYLHLFQRHETRRLSFPALRYLERTEKEHAKQIRLRQLLLLLARVAVLLFVVGAGARLFYAGRGRAHAPTAMVIIIDNSLSSGLVVGEVRVLDELKARAEEVLDAASDDDRFWVIRAGEPWIPAIPGSAPEAREAVRQTEASDAAGDLSSALRRAARLLGTTELENREIDLLSDLQATAFDESVELGTDDIPVVVWTGRFDGGPNRALTGIMVGGGLPPLEGQRATVTVTALEATSPDDTATVPLRLVVNERIRGAATLPPGAQTTIAMPPAGTGWILGYADADPDALRADDRRFFAYRSRPAPTVAVGGPPGVFVEEALAVLEDAGRLERAGADLADLLVSTTGEGLDLRGAGGSVLILPPADPTLLPALDRRLADAGVPWRVDPAQGHGETEVVGRALPEALEGVHARAWYELALSEDPPAPPQTLATVNGRPWAVEGVDANGGRYLLLASSLASRDTDLPVSSGMLRFVDWVTSEWAGAGGALAERVTGSSVPAPASATRVRFPSGSELDIDGTRMVRGTGRAGFYSFLAGDSVVAVVALNPPRSESLLATVDDADLPTLVGPEVVTADDEGEWARQIYRARQGPELWWPLVLSVLVLLVVESLMAASGRTERVAAGTRVGGEREIAA